MRTHYWRALQHLVIFAAWFVLMPAIGRADDQIRLRVTLQLPKKSEIGVNLLQFKEEVERRAGGAVAIEVYDDSKLYTDEQVIAAVASGAIEMGITNYNQFSTAVPAIDIIGQPFLLNFEALVRAATSPEREIRQLLDVAILEATGTRVLWWQAYGSSVFYSKGRVVTRPDQIDGQKIRVSGESYAAFMRQCGGVPLIIPGSKQHKAAKDGTVDMITTGITGLESRKLWEVTDTVTRTEHAALEFVVIINEKVWQQLPKPLQTIFLEAARKVEQDLRDGMADIEARGYDVARAKGMTIHELSADDVAEWRACGAPLMSEYMERGGELAKQLMSAYGKLRTDPCCAVGPGGAFSRH